MLRLHTFGPVVLREDGVPHKGAASQQKRLALLVLIAAAGRRPISRDRLLGYLWPELDAEGARHALGQSLYVVQRALRTNTLFLGTTSLQLNPAVISSDLVDFQDAVAQGAHERVAELYAAPFLDGFFAKGASEFERWAEAERSRLASAYAAALESLASSAAARRDYQSAVNWWRRLAAHDPLSSRYTMGLMQALAAVGDRTGALRLAALHTTLIKQELDAAPDSAVAALEAQLRSGEAVTPPAAGLKVAGGAVTSDARPKVARGARQPRHQEWVERAFGARLLIEKPLETGRAIPSYAAYDRSRGVAVELYLVSPSVVSLVGEENLTAVLERVEALDNPHVVPMYEHSWVDDVLFYVLARPDAPTLREHLERERQLPLAEALDIADGIASALVYAHEHAVQHGNLRPKHVLLIDGRVMVKDFGIVAAISASASEGPAATGLRFGAPGYMSPEQLACETAPDERTDVYSLGCILYEMLAGEVPFASTSQHTLISAKLTQPPPSVRRIRDSVPPELDEILRKCLTRLPSDRLRTVTALRDALDGIRSAV